MEIFDRGNKKWVSIMIPELREALKKLRDEEPIEQPELDEQEIERLNRLLQHAHRTGQPVRIRYWDNGERETAGRIVWSEMGQIRLAGEEGKMYINVNDVIGVELTKIASD